MLSLMHHGFTSILSVLFSLVLRPQKRSTLFPYTTLFRSEGNRRAERQNDAQVALAEAGEPSAARCAVFNRSEEHTSELQSLTNLVCRLLLEKKKSGYDYASR